MRQAHIAGFCLLSLAFCVIPFLLALNPSASLTCKIPYY
jgi:heme/copper-type cytochrome/quinol oxidase subunit 4